MKNRSRRAGAPSLPSLDALLSCLDLDALDLDLYLGDPGPGSGRLYGGMVAAQSIVAAGRTVDRDRSLHSLHAYFLRPGRHDVPLRFVVDRIRDGRSFTTRRVKAHQAGEAIFSLEASFVLPEDGISHQVEMPDVPGPEGVEDWEDVRARVHGQQANHDTPLELRVVDPPDATSADVSPQPVQRAWIRLRGRLPENPLTHTAMLVYLTDRALMGSLRRRHRLERAPHTGASLDHAVWIHRPVRLDDWLLYDIVSPASHAARGICLGSLFQRDGTLIASVAQEALIRLPRN